MTYYIVRITRTARHRSEKGYSTYDTERHELQTIEEVKEYLKEHYAKTKRSRLFRENEDGTSKHVGYTYGFKSSPSSYGEQSGFELHWVEIERVESTPVLIPV